jgi:hypothetical protein
MIELAECKGFESSCISLLLLLCLKDLDQAYEYYCLINKKQPRNIFLILNVLFQLNLNDTFFVKMHFI